MDGHQHYYYNDFEELYLERSKKLMDLYRQWHDAKEKGNEASIKKTIRSINIHKAKNEELKEKAKKAYYIWY